MIVMLQYPELFSRARRARRTKISFSYTLLLYHYTPSIISFNTERVDTQLVSSLFDKNSFILSELWFWLRDFVDQALRDSWEEANVGSIHRPPASSSNNKT